MSPSAPVEGAGAFAALLLEPALAVRVQGVTMHVHRGVLLKIPFFQAKLSGAWADSGSPDVELPCTAREFALLLTALYTGRSLGSALAPVESFAAAVRLAQAAALLAVEELFPELPRLLRSLPRTPEEALAARAVGDALPGPLREALQASEVQIPPGILRQMLLSAAESPAARSAAAVVLARCHSPEQKKAIAEAVGQMFASYQQEKIHWGGELAREWLDCLTAGAVFQRLATGQLAAGFYDQPSPCDRALLEAFCTHLRRCPADGVDWSALMAMGKLRNPASPLTFNSSCRNTLVAVACAANSLSIAQQLAVFPGHQLLEVVTPELLQALGAHAWSVCEAMARQAPQHLRGLITPKLLHGLGPNAGPVCVVLGQLSYDQLRSIVTPELLQAMGPNAGPVSLSLLPRLGHLSGALAHAVAHGATGGCAEQAATESGCWQFVACWPWHRR